MCGACRMNGKGLHICYVCKQREQLKVIDEFLCFFCTTLDLKCKDRTATIREILLVECLLLRVFGNGWMVYFFYLWLV